MRPKVVLCWQCLEWMNKFGLGSSLFHTELGNAAYLTHYPSIISSSYPFDKSGINKIIYGWIIAPDQTIISGLHIFLSDPGPIIVYPVSRRFVRKTFCQNQLRRFVRKTFCQEQFVRHFFQADQLRRFVRKTFCQDRLTGGHFLGISWAYLWHISGIS